MRTTYKINHSFGPFGASAGILLFIVGIVASYYSLWGLLMILTGTFLGFTGTYTTIDLKFQRITFSEKLFGLFSFKHWINIHPSMKLAIRPSKQSWSAYSWSNQSINYVDRNFLIIIYDAQGKAIAPIRKIHNEDRAKLEMERFNKQLGLSVN